jgi:Na+-translocating ferredoxin:NAD+ oxidoreductase RnfG subunit
MKIFYLLLLTVILPVSYLYGQVEPPSNKEDFLKLVKKELKTENVSLYDSDSLNIAIFTDNDLKKEFYFVQSNDYILVKGYRGITNLGIILNRKLEIEKVFVINSQDTSSYIRRIKRSDFLNQFRNYNGNQYPDVVSGATLTCRAINETVNFIADLLKNAINKQ